VNDSGRVNVASDDDIGIDLGKLKKYFNSDKPLELGIPSVSYFGTGIKLTVIKSGTVV
jgi:hypothetical protein